jgi:signal transduction histidine kinase
MLRKAKSDSAPTPTTAFGEAKVASELDDGFGVAQDTHQVLDADEAGVEIGSFSTRWIRATGSPQAPASPGSRPELLLVREVRLGESVMEQGCWLDWPVLRADLLASVRDLLPEADVVPVTPLMDEGGENLVRRLASVPAELIPGNVATAGIVPGAWNVWTPLHNTLLVAWVGVLLAIAAIAYLLRAATDLAERRGRFVSAVTHELRTPLTTFVMYSQMLADGMVPEGEARQHYYTTLKREAGRLAGIVENVLEFARLSRKKRSRSAAAQSTGPMRAAELLERVAVPLRQRADQAGAVLDVGFVGPEGTASELISTVELTLERILFNLVDNACKYGVVGGHLGGPPLRGGSSVVETAAKADDSKSITHSVESPDSDPPRSGGPPKARCTITLQLGVEGGFAVFTVADNGPGISVIDRARIFKAFERGEKQGDGSIPGLGLGLALSRGLARDLGGDLTLLSVSPATFELRVPRQC